MVLTISSLLFLKFPSGPPLSTGLSAPSAVLLCPGQHTAQGWSWQEHNNDWTELLSSTQEEKANDWLTRRWKRDAEIKGKAWHMCKERRGFSQLHCLLRAQGARLSTVSCSLHAEMCGETKKRLWYPTKLGTKPSSPVIKMWLWEVHWALGPSSIKQLQLSKSVVEMREEFCTMVLPDTQSSAQ